MGCGKSKHDVVTGNRTKVRKPSEPESVKGKEGESNKRQESCRCRKKNEISAVVSGDQSETTLENDTKKLENKEDGGDCGEKIAVEMTKDNIKPEEKETTTTSPPVTAIVTEETVNDIKQNVSPVDEQKEEINMETVVEEEKSLEDKNDDDVNSKISSEVEEPKLDEQTPATESEVQEIPTIKNEETAKKNDEISASEYEDIAKENDEISASENEKIAKENDEIAVSENEEIAVAENKEIAKENDEIAATENNEITATENEETPFLEDNVAADAVEESPDDITKDVESA